MCGIVGQLFLSTNAGAPDRAALKRMSDTLLHRGPDGEGFFIDGPIGLGHRRLSIVDLSGGAQPMADAGGRVVVTFNGEIFNHKRLRSELEAAGERFQTNSDTEAIAVGFAHWGQSVVDKLRGQFAFAAWDKAAKRLTLARDHMGIKPLYWTLQDGVLSFASELKALMAVLPSQRLDPRGLDLFLTYGWIPAPHTIYAGIHKLQPGEMLSIEAKADATPKLTRFCPLESFADGEAAPFENADELYQELRRAVDEQLMSDVPLGAFLSGGTDSSAVVMALSELKSAPACYTIGFAEKEIAPQMSRQAADLLGLRLVTRNVSSSALLDSLPSLSAQFDEPFASPSVIPTDALCELARSEVTVALSGDGGDELLGGYDTYFRTINERADPLRGIKGMFAAMIPGEGGTLRRARAAREDAPHHLASHIMQMSAGRRAGLYSRDFRSRLGLLETGQFQAARWLTQDGLEIGQRMGISDLTHFMSEHVLMKVDRLSMRHSLEVRVPMLDVDFVRRAFATPDSQRFVRDGKRVIGGKRILKDALRRRFSDEYVDAKKDGFAAPMKQWLGAKEVQAARELFAEGQGREFFDASAIDGFLAQHQSGTGARHAIYNLLVLGLWLRDSAKLA